MKTIIITGAGSGIGRATAQKLDEQGYDLILVGRTASKLDETNKSLTRQAKCLSIDIANQKEVHDAYKEVLQNKELYAIFANAGIGGENQYGSDDRWAEVLNINLNGTYYSIQEALPFLKSTSGTKHILMTSSCLARFGVPNYTAYCTSKAGLLGLTKSLAFELSNDQILVNALCPGWVETEMAQAGIQKLADRQDVPYQDAYQEQMGFVPLGRMSDPLEIAELVSYLFSPNQRSITGQGLDINNGSFMI